MSPTLREDNELPRYLYPFFEKERFNEIKETLISILGLQTRDKAVILDDKS